MRRVRFVIAFLIIATMILPSTRALFIKPSFTDYAPNGMPDFDEKQDQWGPVAGMYTWCCPVAVANSLWWLDSEYESFMFATPVPPPTISDHFGLVTSYNPQVWDDHDPSNVMGLVPNLAFCMDTDGMRTGDGHTGTRWVDVAPGIQMYLTQFTNVAGMFQVHSLDFPDMEWINNQTEQCQDVELFLEFWWQDVPGGPWYPITNPTFEFGHCVTVAGSDLANVLISDPYFDVAAPGLPSHNDAQFISHDPYPVAPWMIPPGPYGPLPIWELVNYCQINMQLPPTYHAFIRGAVATSPAALPGPTAGLVGITGYKLLFKETVNNSFCIPVTIDYYWDFSIDKWDGAQWVASGISGSSTPVTGYAIPPFTIVDLPCYVYLLPMSGPNAVAWGDWLRISSTFHWTYSGISYSTGYTAKLHVHPGDIAGTTVAFPYLGANNIVNLMDLGLVTGNWQQPVPPGTDPLSNLARADMNGNGFINLQDLGLITGNWQATWTNTPPPG